ncbi:hypothetical protein [Streptomyces sp. NPDC053048]|uniref:hypothetical protein n=1 Tax=Streptomyces sp. NPDC053048 TaxID=3365694 RepID=UPI0037D05C89
MTDATRRTIRTTVQTAITLAALLPVIVDAAGIPATLPWAAGALAIAAGLTRVMAVPEVQALLPRWLRTAPTAPPASTEGGTA